MKVTLALTMEIGDSTKLSPKDQLLSYLDKQLIPMIEDGYNLYADKDNRWSITVTLQ